MLDYILTLMGRDDSESFSDSTLEFLHTQVSNIQYWLYPWYAMSLCLFFQKRENLGGEKKEVISGKTQFSLRFDPQNFSDN